jgi:glycosyltransferase involved in cell wall biosynthesis
VLVVCDDWLVYGPIVDGWAKPFADRPRIGRVAGRVVRRRTGVPTNIADLGRIDAVCFVSDAVRTTAAHHTPWNFRRTTVTYSGIDRTDFGPLAAGEEAGPWRGRLLYVGRLDPRKGVETLLRALALLSPEYRLEIVGPGETSYVDQLRRLAISLGIGDRVCFADAGRDRVRARYLGADAVVFPSEWAEPFGLVPLEAMASGRPVIATGTGGSAEFLDHEGNCLLFAPGDHRELARAVERLRREPALRGRLIDAGLRTADGFDTERLARVLEEWHVAAAHRFAHGEPAPDLPPVLHARP